MMILTPNFDSNLFEGVRLSTYLINDNKETVTAIDLES
jgi:hypothetical protein